MASSGGAGGAQAAKKTSTLPRTYQQVGQRGVQIGDIAQRKLTHVARGQHQAQGAAESSSGFGTASGAAGLLN
eukprot:scaffold913_cov233-Pinguiococcus_pyrenoidosus.AAC.4